MSAFETWITEHDVAFQFHGRFIDRLRIAIAILRQQKISVNGPSPINWIVT